MSTHDATVTMTGDQMVALSKQHTIFEWSAQDAVDPIPVARAKGVYFWTPEGKRFIDFNSQLMCVNIGHGDERVVAAIQEQAARCLREPVHGHRATRAARREAGRDHARATSTCFFFTNGGAEANENAIKIARMFTGRHKILARYRSYHGATAGAITLTGDPRRWAAEPGIPGVVHVLGPVSRHRARLGLRRTSRSRCSRRSSSSKGRSTIAAFILETVTGTNGILIPPDGYLRASARCATSTAS